MSHAGNKQNKRGKTTKDKLSKNAIAKAERVRTAIDAGLEKFEQHKNALIPILRNAHKLGPRTKPFDQPTSWLRLAELARAYHCAAALKKETLQRAYRKARLRVLAKTIGRARGLIEQAMKDDIGDELIAAWHDETHGPPALAAYKTFVQAVKGVEDLEATVLRASQKADRERLGAGRPKGTSVLPDDYIIELGSAYLSSTGMEPKTDREPFALVVRNFLDAIGHKDRISERHMLEMIENAFNRAKKRPNL